MGLTKPFPVFLCLAPSYFLTVIFPPLPLSTGLRGKNTGQLHWLWEIQASSACNEENATHVRELL